ncbi:mannitol-1-phosphate 5-dehydrogenase [Agromyces atrinae]|uniref:mannitol-1-phosphate 5-dehydrogenase n=1 Tax=Agromyces atrinae TaxID=592376 RepID=UPI001F59ECAF|nr:mannitol-1-phosphate 5-dehydrogenase [Agromyces atrinae]MCI2957835.1 mannitol-1-phosphate 5-dehydrogenase [Agromyces atrinae]
MKAVHFGAGNIGRGFIGLLLHEAGYELVFADVAAPLIDALAASESYTVHEVGAGARDHVVTGYSALNSATDEGAVRAAIADADTVTTAVGPTILRFIAPHIVAALEARDAARGPLVVMACENAINATDLLRDEMSKLVPTGEWEALASRAVFANTAVDRIVPGQSADAGLDVTVETFSEWAIESGPFGSDVPEIPGAHFVDDLAPYIERKLFTVNTGHATVAYAGFLAGHERISDALADPAVAEIVETALRETSALLVAKHEFDPAVQDAYRETILERFANTALPDTVDRVGRQPLRKLSRHERFIGPAAELAERGLPTAGLLAAIAAAVRFDVPADEQSVELKRLRTELSPEQFAAEVCGIDASHPLFAPLVAALA